MLQFIIFIIIISYAVYKSELKSNTTLEGILRKKSFQNITLLPITKALPVFFITATKGSTDYLFAKLYNNNSVPLSTIIQYTHQTASKLKSDRIIIYYNSETVPIELTKIATTYKIEIWNKYGTSNFDSYRTVKPNTNTSRLANTLKEETIPFEHKPNGVIAKDTCHIAPTISPIEENPKTFFKKKETQRL